jgi:exopolyphosphatase / guanosine-5'-triphosphate,3'-diphosphate pyrophosphatase
VTRLAAVDLGTNSTRLLVAEVGLAGGEKGEEKWPMCTHGPELTDVVRCAVVTRLGEGVDAERRLRPAAIDRVLAVLAEFRDQIVAFGAERTLAVGTSAVRDASNGGELLAEVERRFGFATRLLSGDEEAELTRRGVGALNERTLLLDVGGGSTELILGWSRTSLDVGSVRLTERFLASDPPRPDELDAAAAHVRSLLPALEPAAAVGVAATVRQLETLLGEITPGALDVELARLAALPLADRRRVPGLDPERAPVIVAGALIVAEVLRRYGLRAIAFSARDLLDGVVMELARRK